ncbi:hypothetical protein CRM22_009428 [Opisthorchis felineus]|uniref:BSD domain-containing protein n=1 Tax=Opisthorchis felineus TaxID=147828 RepID=A0A4S2L8W6_OPIFE|nr:hypothetical protein CRM22_009428 [Opisthorchis felineus]
MNFLRSYASSLSEFVAHVIDDPSESTNEENKLASPKAELPNTVSETTEQVGQPQDERLFGWIPSLKSPTGDNAVVYYMNSLASLGSEPTSEQTDPDLSQREEKGAIVEDVRELTIPTDVSSTVAEPPSGESSDLDMAFMNWISGLSLRTEQVWQQMKQDLTEVVSAISVEPKDAVTRTASSVRQHLSSVAEAARKIDASQFHLLPENTADGKELKSVLDSANEESKPPEFSELPSLSNLRTDVSSFVQGVLSSLFGSDESTRVPVKDRREARLHVLRADPATYEVEPPSPPAHLNVLNYADWRAAYFDEVTCQPLPGIPLCGARNAANEGHNPDELLQPVQPSPEELLDQNPFMRTYLSQLVRIEGQADNKGITDGDFWSRYYYRVWLLDVTEQRRRRLTERVGHRADSSVNATDTTDGNRLGTDAFGGENGLNMDTSDWFDHSDTEALSPRDASPGKKSTSEKPCGASSTPCSPGNPAEKDVTETVLTGNIEKSDKRGGKHRRRRGKKRSESDRNSTSDEILHSDATTKAQLGLERSPTYISGTAVTTTVAGPPNFPLLSDDSPKNENSRVVIESDEPATSGSSSVVVLSNSEDDPEGGSFHGKSRLAPVAAERSSRTRGVNASDDNLDDWGEVSEDEFETLPSSSANKPDAPPACKEAEEGVECRTAYECVQDLPGRSTFASDSVAHQK